MSNFAVDRRGFLGALGAAALGTTLAAGPSAQQAAAQNAPKKKWRPAADRKVRVGIVGYGFCKFGAQFGFQNHPNVEVAAVSDLIPERRKGLMKACRCAKSYESLEVLVKDPKIEAVFVATDAPSHARHSIEVLKNGKHVMSAVPATFGSIEEGEKLLETVKKTGLKYMMAETSCFREDCWGMRQIYQAGGFGRLVYSEGEYFHYRSTPLDSYKGWRIGSPPLWYPTHSTAYYVGVTGKRFVSVSCAGFRAGFDAFKPGANRYKNEFTDEIALFRTSEGGTSRQCMCKSVIGYHAEAGRVFGEKGSMNGTRYSGKVKKLPDITRPALPPGVPGGGHGGSHGRLTDEFITSILADREPLVNIYEALSMTAGGIVAHQSALKDGETMKVPQYLPPKSK
ncbi:MAG: Gfo/Idh/MocA family oxidoreductase [Phycisphaerae bacterium]|nr:Gfo/Idh/MocA family oxidoreductase [Phycisphaerae bacterium]